MRTGPLRADAHDARAPARQETRKTAARAAMQIKRGSQVVRGLQKDVVTPRGYSDVICRVSVPSKTKCDFTGPSKYNNFAA